MTHDLWKHTTEKTVSKEELERALTHSINYHSLDANCNEADFQLSKMMIDEVWKHLCGETDAQVIERRTPEERRKI